MLDDIFMRVLDMSVAAGIVILAVLLLRLFLKRAPKVFSYALWAVVLFRLLCPVTVEAPVSIVPEMTSVSKGYTLSEEPISVLGAGEAAYQAVGDALNGGLGIQHIRTTEKTETGMTKYVTADWRSVWILFGQYVWAAGVAAMLLYSAVSYLKIRKKLSVVVPLWENIFIADDIQSPFVIGLFRPKIYLPCSLGEKEQEYIILHEQHHIRRLDHVVKALAFLALAVHWFNPLVWAAFILAGKDMEMSCDEAVVRKMGEGIRADYSASLLTLATGRRIIAGTPLAFGEGDTKGRIKNLANWRRPAFWVILLAVVLCVLAAVSLLTNSSPSRQSPAGMGYTYEGEGFGGAFEIEVKEDGTFTYYEGLLSSYTGYGAWSVSDDILTLTDDTGVERVNHFRIDGERLVFIEKNSSNFLYVKVEDGAVFRGAALTDAAAGDTGKFYLTIGAEGAAGIEVTTPNTSGGCQNADGSLFQPGEQVWLEALDGFSDLRGVEITAYNEAGNVIWTASVPDTEENRGVTHLTVDGWTITNLK